MITKAANRDRRELILGAKLDDSRPAAWWPPDWSAASLWRVN